MEHEHPNARKHNNKSALTRQATGIEPVYPRPANEVLHERADCAAFPPDASGIQPVYPGPANEVHHERAGRSPFPPDPLRLRPVVVDPGLASSRANRTPLPSHGLPLSLRASSASSGRGRRRL